MFPSARFIKQRGLPAACFVDEGKVIEVIEMLVVTTTASACPRRSPNSAVTEYLHCTCDRIPSSVTKLARRFDIPAIFEAFLDRGRYLYDADCPLAVVVLDHSRVFELREVSV